MPRIPYNRYALICNLYASGLRTVEVAKRLGISRRALSDIRKSEGFQSVYREIQSELLNGAKEVVGGGAIAANKLLIELVDDDRYEMRDRLQAAKFLSETNKSFLERLEEQTKKEDDSNLLIPRDDSDV